MEFATLYIGATCDDVRELKRMLKGLGYRVNEAAPDYDVRTRSAVEAFQNDAGLRVDGIVGGETWAALERTWRSRGVEAAEYGAVGFKGDLSEGARGERVLAMQQRLAALGYYDGAVDGMFGPKTTAAVRAFQKRAGLAADGVAGDYTWGALFGAADAASRAAVVEGGGGDLSEGCRGERVAALQNQLAALGFYYGSIDGVFGPQTEAAVRAFQAQSGLNVDGVAGEQTWTALFEARGAAAAVAPASLPAGRAEGGRARMDLDDYPSLWYGDYGNYVKELQDRLHSSRHFAGHSTGVFDEATAQAVKRFQQDCGMAADGVVKKEFWKAMNVGR